MINLIKKMFAKRNRRNGRNKMITEGYPLVSDGINFTMHQATGGIVIEVRFYDRKQDETLSSLYIIPSGNDIGEELSKILTVEKLKK